MRSFTNIKRKDINNKGKSRGYVKNIHQILITAKFPNTKKKNKTKPKNKANTVKEKQIY